MYQEMLNQIIDLKGVKRIHKIFSFMHMWKIETSSSDLYLLIRDDMVFTLNHSDIKNYNNKIKKIIKDVSDIVVGHGCEKFGGK